jgi:hypothetical protein
MRQLLLTFALTACGSATARLEMSNQTPMARSSVLADGTSLRLKIVAIYLAEDVDPMTMNNIGSTEMIWLNPECNGDISDCNVDGFDLPAGPRVTQYFDLARSSDEVTAELESEDLPIDPGSYRYARIELCKAYDQTTHASVPTMMWAGPGMTDEQPFTSGDCGRTSLAFDPPLAIAAGDAVTVDLGYDLGKAIVAGAPDPVSEYMLAGSDHFYRACDDTSDASRVCMDFPDFAPTATKL